MKLAKDSNIFLFTLHLAQYIFTVFIINIEKHWWFSGKIGRCHRLAPGSIPGQCIFLFCLFQIESCIIFAFNCRYKEYNYELGPNVVFFGL